MPPNRSTPPTQITIRCSRAVVALLAVLLATTGLTLPTATGPARATTSTTNYADKFTSRITARWQDVTDGSGRVWKARGNSLGTTNTSTALVGKTLAGTADPTPYAVSASGLTAYSLAVPYQGTYQVRLLMAEHAWTSAGQRVFDVTAEGQRAAAGVDIAGAVGRQAAHEVTFTAPVRDGRLDLGFVAVKDKPLVSGIEVTLTELDETTLSTGSDGAPGFVVRSVAATTDVKDGAGHTWAPREGFNGTTRLSTIPTTTDIIGTEDDQLYRSLAPAITGYQTAVPVAGLYRVRLLAAENWWTKPGQRVFTVSAEGKVIDGEIDIVAAVGTRAAFDRTFETVVTDGGLDLAFTASADLPVIAGVEVTYLAALDTTPKVTFTKRQVAETVSVTDAQGQAWVPFGTNLGTTNRSRALVGKGIRGTDDDNLYQVTAIGPRGYVLPVPSTGRYEVRLLLTESFWTQPGQRVFDVRSEGQVVAPDVDIVGAVGKGAAHDVTFESVVTDGHLTIEFVAKVDQPMISGIEVVSETAAGLTRPKQAVTFAPDSFYTSSLASAPVAANSAVVVAKLARDVAERNYGIAAVNSHSYNASFYAVPADQPKVDVAFADCQGKGYEPPDLHTGPAYFHGVPIPPNAVPAAGTDAQLTIYDPAADKIWEFWRATKLADGSWKACWGGRLDAVSTQQGFFASPIGASASGLVMAGGMITIDEVLDGHIGHAMYLGVVNAGIGHSWPANRNDGNVDDPDVIVEGQRLRLDPTVDVKTLGLTPFGEMVAEAGQKYGFIVSDRAGTVGVVTESGQRVKSVTGTDPWDLLLGQGRYTALQGFPWERLEAMPVDYGKPGDATAGPISDPTPTPNPSPTDSVTATPAPVTDGS